MRLSTRKLLNTSFSSLGIVSILFMALFLLVILTPIFIKGSAAVFFKGTVEFRQMMLQKFERGNPCKLDKELNEVTRVRQPLYDMMGRFEEELQDYPKDRRKELKRSYRTLKKELAALLGPLAGDPQPILWREQFGQTRWDRAQKKLHRVLYTETWDYSDPSKMGQKVFVSRAEEFKGTALEPFFTYLEENIEPMLRPRMTFYWRFFFDESFDSHFFGGIWAEILGTLYLTIGALMFAIPFGVIAAIYLTEYAKPSPVISFLRSCISTLAGVPSIVFGLFGLAFFIDTLGVSSSKSVLAGSMTLALLILPTIIRTSEEAIRAVPRTYKEAALSLGASKWGTVLSVTVPAALPGILTGIVISMGRAAGETAPIIFTAAVSVGKPLNLIQTLSNPTPALPWNIYNLCTEHEAVDEIRHVQFGMVLTLVGMVLLLNLTVIVLRARISRKLKG